MGTGWTHCIRTDWQTDGQMEGQTDGQMNRQKYGRSYGGMKGWTGRPSYTLSYSNARAHKDGCMDRLTVQKHESSNWLTDRLTDWRIDWQIDWRIDWRIDWQTDGAMNKWTAIFMEIRWCKTTDGWWRRLLERPTLSLIQYQTFAFKGCSWRPTPAHPRCADWYNNGTVESASSRTFEWYV